MAESRGSEITAVIPNGTALSGQIVLTNQRLSGLTMPAAWTAAGLTFQYSHDGTTWKELQTFDGSTKGTVAVDSTTAAAGTGWMWIGDYALAFDAIRMLRIRSGTALTPVNQGADRTFTLPVVDR